MVASPLAHLEPDIIVVNDGRRRRPRVRVVYKALPYDVPAVRKLLLRLLVRLLQRPFKVFGAALRRRRAASAGGGCSLWRSKLVDLEPRKRRDDPLHFGQRRHLLVPEGLSVVVQLVRLAGVAEERNQEESEPREQDRYGLDRLAPHPRVEEVSDKDLQWQEEEPAEEEPAEATVEPPFTLPKRAACSYACMPGGRVVCCMTRVVLPVSCCLPNAEAAAFEQPLAPADQSMTVRARCRPCIMIYPHIPVCDCPYSIGPAICHRPSGQALCSRYADTDYPWTQQRALEKRTLEWCSKAWHRAKHTLQMPKAACRPSTTTIMG
jgi:hypothetical protein